MTQHDLFTVGVRLLALWLISTGACYLLTVAIGPFAYLAVGGLLLVIARRIWRF